MLHDGRVHRNQTLRRVKMPAPGMAALDLERAIGFNGGADSPLHALGDGGTGYAHASGACVVLSDLADPSRQHFLRGHSEDVSCLAVSSSGRYAASGQNGGEPDVLVWDLSTQTLVYRLQALSSRVRSRHAAAAAPLISRTATNALRRSTTTGCSWCASQTTSAFSSRLA